MTGEQLKAQAKQQKQQVFEQMAQKGYIFNPSANTFVRDPGYQTEGDAAQQGISIIKGQNDIQDFGLDRQLKEAELANKLQSNSATKDLSIEELIKLNESGANLPVGSKATDAKGIVPKAAKTADQKAAEQKASALRRAVGDIKRYSDKVNDFGAAKRPYKAKQRQLENYLQTNPDVVLLDSQKGKLSLLVKTLFGEAGALAEGDIQRAVKLVPDITDTKQVAQQKLADLAVALQDLEAKYGSSGSTAAPAASGGESKSGFKILNQRPVGK